jgi:uncharacterized protein (DUF1800 family)
MNHLQDHAPHTERSTPPDPAPEAPSRAPAWLAAARTAAPRSWAWLAAAAGATTALPALARTDVTPTVLMDWAEGVLPQHFPGHKANQSAPPYTYRYYPETGTYMGVSGTDAYVLGPLTGGVLTRVGSLADFACGIDATNCTVQPASANEAARFLAQATLGASKAQIGQATGMTYAAWIDEQIAMPRGQSRFDWLAAKGYNAETYRNSAAGLDNALWAKLFTGTDALRQRMTLALSEIFVVSVTGVAIPWRQFAVARYVDLLEENAFGNFRALIEAISRSTAMSVYLTFNNNAKASASGSQPDENYARELMQLFTIGLYRLNADGTLALSSGAPVETYAPADVSGLARVFTGWVFNATGLAVPVPPDVHLRNLTQRASNYETGAKSFLGVTIPAGTSADDALRIALDTVFNHANTAPFFARQLIQRLVTSNPSPAYVGRVAAVFANNGGGTRGDLAATLRAVLLDVDARDPYRLSDPLFGKLREPVQRLLNWGRGFGAASPSGNWAVGDLSDAATRLGQSPMRSSSVFNFFRPGYVPPGTAIAQAGYVAPEMQITHESSVAGYVNYMQAVVAGSRIDDVRADYAGLLTLVNDPAALLAELNLVLAAGQLSAATLETIRAAIATINASTAAGASNRLYAALVLVLATPEYIVQK